MLNASWNETDIRVATFLRSKSPQIIASLTREMNRVLALLEANIADKQIPAKFPNGAPNIVSSVRHTMAEQQGDIITGIVESGGPNTTKTTKRSGAIVDYAEVQERGRDFMWVILPYDARVLAFRINGQMVFAHRVVHPGLEAKRFMRGGLEDMREEIIERLRGAILRGATSE